MPALQSPPPPDASDTQRGLVSTVAQLIAGPKTFLAALIASAGIQLSRLFNTNGAGSTDVVVRVGTTVADATVNAAAKLLSGGTGINATEVEKFFFRKAGSLVVGADTANPICLGNAADLANVADGFKYNVGAAEIGVFSSNNAAFLGLNLGTGAARASGSLTLGGRLNLPNATGGAVVQGSNQAFYGSDFDASLNFRPGISASYDSLSFKLVSGRIDRRGTDTTGTPGPAVVNDRASGKAAIAAGASSVVITCNQVTAASQVFITQHARDATCKELIAVPALGSFTVSGTANATAALPFSWEVSTLI